MSLVTLIPAAASIIKDAIGLFSDDKKAKAESVLKELDIAQESMRGQIEINKAEASHRSTYVAGWRPLIGYICGISLGLYFIPKYALGAFFYAVACWESQQVLPYPIDVSGLWELVAALLGLGGLRSYEKDKGVSK